MNRSKSQLGRRLSRRDLLRAGGAALLGGVALRSPAHAAGSNDISRVSWRVREALQQSDGRILEEAADGGIMFQERDGRIHLIEASDLVSRQDYPGTTFRPMASNELAIELKKQFGAGFGTEITPTHVICTNTNRVYAQWVGDMFSRLQKGFDNFWRGDKLSFHQPEFPLTVLAFAERKEFAEYALSDADASTAVSFGYYSLKSNRVALFDLTTLAKAADRLKSISDISRMMQSFQGNVSNIVHEAVHQLSFNCGLHTRYADNPLWLIEGLATVGEIPDLQSRNGWRMFGKANKPRVAKFASYYKSGNRPADSLVSLIRDDRRFTAPETALDAYAEAWGLNYYLIEKRRREYIEYLQHQAAKPVLKYLTPDERQQEFEKFFGSDWEKLDEEMVGLLRLIQR